MNKASLLYIYILCLVAAAPIHAAHTFDCRRISSAYGLPSNTVFYIVQDKGGLVWMGTNSGLGMFDGYGFVNFKSVSCTPHTYIEPRIMKIMPDSTNRLIWAQTSAFIMTCYDPQKARFADYTGKNDFMKPYRHTMADRQGMWMWGLTPGARRVEYVGGTFRCTDYNSQNSTLPHNRILKVMTGSARQTWIATEKGVVAVAGSKAKTLWATKGKVLAANMWKGRLLAIDSRTGLNCSMPGGRWRTTTMGRGHTAIARQCIADIVWRDKWIVFTDGATLCIDLATGKCSTPASLQMPKAIVMERTGGCPPMLTDNEGRLMMLLDNGEVKRLNLLADGYSNSTMGQKVFAAKGGDGRIYLATGGNGLFVYDTHSGGLEHFKAGTPGSPILTNSLQAIYTTADGSVWIANEDAGVSHIAPQNTKLCAVIEPAPGHANNMANMARTVAHGRDGKIIVATKDNSVYTFNPETRTYLLEGKTKSCMYAWLDDGTHRWMGTRGDGLYVDGRKVGPETGFAAQHIYDIKRDSRGRTWIATWDSGLFAVEYKYGKARVAAHFLDSGGEERHVRKIVEDKSGWMWIATCNGLFAIDSKQRHIAKVKPKRFDNAGGKLPITNITCLLADSKGRLWTGSLGHGLLKNTTDGNGNIIKTETITHHNGLANNNIRSITEDRNGFIWVGTEDGLARINPVGNQATGIYTGGDIAENVFAEGAAITTADGKPVFATNKGVAIVTPDTKKAGEAKAETPVITNLTVNGVSAYSNPETAKHADAIRKNRTVRLEHNQNSIALYFSNLMFGETGQSVYAFFMEGADTKPQMERIGNKAEYNNLPPGTYTFHVKTMTNNCGWSNEKTVRFVIMQPWYNTWWAWAAYIAALAAAAYYIYAAWRRNFRLKQQMAMEKQMTDFRINFFTNIAHEFRTPLALIAGAVDKLAQPQAAAVSKTAVQTAKRGTARLLRQVNMLMDFRRANTGCIKLGVEPADMAAFVRDICHDFRQQAAQKDIALTFQPCESRLAMPFDKRLVETIVYNLLGNAIKYTPQHGSVTVRLYRHNTVGEGKVCIAVKDSGPGIPDSQKEHLFKPFMHGYVSAGGMGIGLYTAKNMAETHKGTLNYEKADTGGCLFTLTLPANGSCYAEADRKQAFAPGYTTQAQQTDMDIMEMMPLPLNKQTIAIIEDDPDMMQQISGEMGILFRTRCFASGKDALQDILQEPPALVICDVMLPDTDGHEVVRTLRKNELTNRVPVIMLTALDDDTHRLKAYKAGADDYMVKPCNFSVLAIKAAKLIERGLQATETHCTQQNADIDAEGNNTSQAAQAIITSQADKAFIDKVELIVEQHIADPAFGVDRLAAALGMGRTKLYGKMNTLVGTSPNKYIMEKRMQRAARLIEEGGLTVTEVSYKVGVDNTSYFYKCFKERYGVTPAGYAKQNLTRPT